ncbi:MAG: hypothetical protein P1Q69_05550 [Candidatus Thorarchaeota archaeon]|nr:hypothetical protein [Candidatus Thorarchaeota archaeon]
MKQNDSSFHVGALDHANSRLKLRRNVIPPSLNRVTRTLLESFLLLFSIVPGILLAPYIFSNLYLVFVYPVLVSVIVGSQENWRFNVAVSVLSSIMVTITVLYFFATLRGFAFDYYLANIWIVLLCCAVAGVSGLLASKLTGLIRFNTQLDRYITAANESLSLDQDFAILMYEKAFQILDNQCNGNYSLLDERLSTIYKHTLIQLSDLKPTEYDKSILTRSDKFDTVLMDMRIPELDTSEIGVVVLRGCELVGGQFEYKVKVSNESGFVITEVSVMLVAYPEDSLKLVGDRIRTVNRIEVGGFRSLRFVFSPSKDCVEGSIQSNVSFTDPANNPHSMQAQPYIIKSVCDLLTKADISLPLFDELKTGLEQTHEETIIDWNPHIAFEKIRGDLSSKNFQVVKAESTHSGGQFIGTLNGYAEGKYTGKKVAAIISITGYEGETKSTIRIDVLGDDISMLPTTLTELSDAIGSWICISCGSTWAPSDVNIIRIGGTVKCEYCGSENDLTSLTKK